LSTTTTTATNTSENQRHNPKKNERLLVVGSGVAGSSAALIAAETYKIPVTLLFAGNVPQDCNSFWAQGGIIYRNYDPASGDSAESLANDIHRAGAGLCNDDAVRKVSTEGPDRVRELLLRGGPFADVPFDKKPDGELSLCLGTLWNLLYSCRPHPTYCWIFDPFSQTNNSSRFLQQQPKQQQRPPMRHLEFYILPIIPV
jgi:L-aspartate oxidase